MKGRLRRTLAVAVTDLRVRLRRPSSLWLVAVLALGAYFMIPPPSQDSALLVIHGARALYTSGTLAFATAALLPLFLGLFGFYLVSHAIGEDRLRRTGPLIASTPVSNGEYLSGKLLGSVGVLGAVTFAFLLCAMGMHTVRGEGPLEPLVYLRHYLVIAGPCIVGLAALALFFECAPGLSGRAGDVAYFFVWGMWLTLSLEPWRGGPGHGGWIGGFFDFMGLGFVSSQVSRLTGASDFSIGYGPRHLDHAPIHFAGLSFAPEWLLLRAWSLILPALFFVAALALFRRFDPARTKARASRRRFSLLALADVIARPVTRRVLALLDRVPARPAAARPSFLGALAADILVSARLSPVLVVVAVASAVLALTLPPPLLRTAALPVLFAVLAALLADVPTRESRFGVAGMVFAAPHTRALFVPLKLASAMGVGLLVTGVPALRLLASEPKAAVSVIVGTLVWAAGAVLLGVISGSPKTFVAVALAFWYIVFNSDGRVPSLDFAGWYAQATPGIQASWIAAAAGAGVLALAIDKLRARAAA